VTRDQKLDLGLAIGVAAALVLGLRRTAGAVAGVAGVWYLTQDRKLAGGASLAAGSTFLFWPEWPEQLGAALRLYAGRSASSSPALPALSTGGPGDVDLGGGWTMLDVSNVQSDAGRAKLAQGLKVGTVVGLALSSRGAVPVLYMARVITPGFGAYAGQWADRSPPGGPQMVDFGPEHVLL